MSKEIKTSWQNFTDKDHAETIGLAVLISFWCVLLIAYLVLLGRTKSLEKRNTELDAQIIRLEHSLDQTDKALIELRQEFNELKYEYTLHKRHPVKAQ